MKKFVYIGVFLSCFVFTANAAVTFLPQSSNSVGVRKKSSTSMSIAQKCINAGYSKTKCPANQNAIDPCPYSRSYFKYCCDEKYQYTINECKRAGLSHSSNSCGGLYECL